MNRKKKPNSNDSSTPPPNLEGELEGKNTPCPESPDGDNNIEDRIMLLSKEIEQLKQEIEDLETGKLDSIVPELYREMLQKTGVAPPSIQQTSDVKPKEEQEQEQEEEQTLAKPAESKLVSPRKTTQIKAKQKETKSLQITDLFPTIKCASPTVPEKEAFGPHTPEKYVEIEKEDALTNNEYEQEKIKEIQKKLNATIKYALRKDSGIFDHRITEEEVPAYSSVILHGMDLSLIQKGIDEGKYLNCKSAEEAIGLFVRDLMLIFANAFIFNRPGTDVWKFASNLKSECFNHLNESRLWPIQDVVPSKRKAPTNEKGSARKKAKK